MGAKRATQRTIDIANRRENAGHPLLHGQQMSETTMKRGI